MPLTFRPIPVRVPVNRPGRIFKSFDVHLFPTTLVIGRDGKVAGTVDALEHGRIGAMIEELLAEETPRR